MSRVALLIGMDAYADPQFPPLTAPRGDVERLAALLRDPAVGFFDSVELMYNRPAHEVLSAVEKHTSGRTSDDFVLLSLSCHDEVDLHSRLHFAATNSRPDRLASTAVSDRFINDQLSYCLAGSRVLLLDCCFSGRFGEGFASKATTDPLKQVSGRGYVVLTAADEFSVAYEEQTAARSVFTDVIVEGLRTGKADCDADGLISTADLFSYVAPQVQGRVTQKPQYLAWGVDGKVVLARAASKPSPQSSPVAAKSVSSQGSPGSHRHELMWSDWVQRVARALADIAAPIGFAPLGCAGTAPS